MASIYKRGKTWTANVFAIIDGDRKRITKSGFHTKAAAQAWSNETEVSKQKNSLVINQDILLIDYFKEWFDTFKKEHVTKTTVSSYKYTENIIAEYLKNIKLQKISRAQFQTFLNKYGKTHSQKTAKKIRMHIRQMAQAALIDGLISKDFTANTRAVGKESKSADLKFLEVEDMKKLILELESRPISERAVTDMMILTGLQTGARYAEIAGLTWNDFDYTASTIQISNSWDQLYKEFKPTKTNSSMRTIDVSTHFTKELLEWRRVNSNTTFIFETSDELPPTSAAANHQLKRLLTRINADKIITFHGLRHTHASWLLSQGIDMQYVSERLGHKSYEITLETYTHLLQQKRDTEINKSVSLLENL